MDDCFVFCILRNKKKKERKNRIHGRRFLNQESKQIITYKWSRFCFDSSNRTITESSASKHQESNGCKTQGCELLDGCPNLGKQERAQRGTIILSTLERITYSQFEQVIDLDLSI